MEEKYHVVNSHSNLIEPTTGTPSIDLHLKNVYAEEGTNTIFIARIPDAEGTVSWFKNGDILPFDPRYEVDVEGEQYILFISSVKKNDAGIYTIICDTKFGFVTSQAMLAVTPKLKIHPLSALYLTWPKSEMKITKHLCNQRIIVGDPIELKLEIKRPLKHSPVITWYRNNRNLSTFNEFLQNTGVKNDNQVETLTRYNADIIDSGLYTVIIEIEEMILSSSSEVVVYDPDYLPAEELNGNGFIQYLPQEMIVPFYEDVRLTCVANIDSNTSISWSRDGKSLKKESKNIKCEILEGRVVVLLISSMGYSDVGLYSVVVRNDRTGIEAISQCMLIGFAAPRADPIITVEKPLKVVISPLGARVGFYCKFGMPPLNSTHYAVWHFGSFSIERSTSQFLVISNNLGMYVLIILCVDIDMLGEVSCEIRQVLPCNRTMRVAITKSQLINVPKEKIDEETSGDNPMLSKKICADMEYEKTELFCITNQHQQSSCSDYSDDNVAMAGEEVDKLNETNVAMTLEKAVRLTEAVKEEKEEAVMEIVYSRLEYECCHFLTIHSSQRKRMIVMARTIPQLDDDDAEQSSEDTNQNLFEYVLIEWNNDGDISLPPGKLYAVDLAQQPTGAYYRVGKTKDPKIKFKSILLKTPIYLMLLRVSIVSATEEYQDFVIYPPTQTNTVEHTDAPHLPYEVYKQEYCELIENLGCGSYGEVRLVQHKNGKLYAAKILKTVTILKRVIFFKEINIMKKLHHHRIVQLHASFSDRSRLVMVMEYLSGGELLERLIEQVNFREDMAVHYVQQICDGLAYMHAHYVIHLDIKPENIVCASRNSCNIKIVDFGLSKVYEPNTQLRSIYGTTEYMSPEGLNFDPISPASDMWSLGVVTYVLLSGFNPFCGQLEHETATNIIKGDYNFEDPVFVSVSEEAKDFIRSLLQPSPDDRLTAVSAQHHTWMVMKPAHELGIVQTMRWRKNMKSYLETNKNRWQRAGKLVMVANRMLLHHESSSVAADDAQAQVRDLP